MLTFARQLGLLTAGSLCACQSEPPQSRGRVVSAHGHALLLGQTQGVGQASERWTPVPGGVAVQWRDLVADTDGQVVLQVHVGGEVVPRGPGVLRIDTPDEQAWTFDGLHAWTADGQPLAARLSGQGATVRIEAWGAQPGDMVHIDPVLRTAPFQAAFAADGLAGVGDLNADGYDDVAAGAVGGTTATPGQVTIWPGSPTGPDPAVSWSPTPAAAAWEYGRSVAGAGDVNADGYADLVVGGSDSAWVHLGAATGTGDTLHLVDPSGGGTELGFAVAGAGDLDGDGVDDLVVGDPGFDAARGRVLVYPGVAGTGPEASSPTAIEGDSAGGWFGVAVAGAGDVQADGYADLIVGEHAWSGITGRAHLFDGSPDGVGDTPSRTLTGIHPLDNFGRAVDGAGDVDRDGYDDVVIGAFNGAGAYGLAVVHHGSPDGVAALETTRVVGPAYGAKFGQTVAGLGDVDGDGFVDVGMGGHGTTTQAGIHHGAPSGVSEIPVPRLTGGVTLGKILDGAGDVNGDGYADLTVADPGAGTVSIHLGGPDRDGDGWISPEDCDDADTAVRGGFLAYTDADGDGTGDPATAVTVCSLGVDQVLDGTDCDDTDPDVFVGAPDAPGDRRDSNCDGLETCFEDIDGDGVLADDAPEVTVVWAELGLDCTAYGYHNADAPRADCDDTDPAVSPALPEACNGRDTDCSGAIDHPVPPDAPVWVPDADADGVPADSPQTQACTAPDGLVRPRSPADCDDTDATIAPGRSEVPGDGIDQDCDGTDTTLEPGDSADPDDTRDAPKSDSGCAHAPGGGVFIALLGVLGLRRRQHHLEHRATGPAVD